MDQAEFTRSFDFRVTDQAAQEDSLPYAHVHRHFKIFRKKNSCFQHGGIRKYSSGSSSMSEHIVIYCDSSLMGGHFWVARNASKRAFFDVLHAEPRVDVRTLVE